MSNLNFGKFNRDPLSDKVAERLINLIRDQKLQPGDRLPPERELADRMGVSRPVIRSALQALSMMKIVENRKKDGTYITSLEPEQLVEHLEFVFSLNVSTYLDLLKVRMVVEPALAEFAARNVTDRNIRKLELSLERSKTAINDPQIFLESDLELHRIICYLAQSPILCTFMDSLVNLGIHSRKRTVEIPEMRYRTIEDHESIVEALKSRDPYAASLAMRDHLTHVEDRLKQIARTNHIHPNGE
jgi:GntR family transcriptional repressor for pyruvate dehydrogenase complex